MDYGWLAIVPPIIAIILAIITKEVFLSLGLGIFAGAMILTDYNLIASFEKVFSTMFAKVGDPAWNIPILAFLLILGGLTALMIASGGSRAFGEWAIRKVKNRQGAQWLAFIGGLVIFIDDYFNSLAVGSVSRPVTDRQNISRAKLAYIIDSTAAPVVILAPLSSWGAYIISLIAEQLTKSGSTLAPFTAFVKMIPMNFYALLSLVMVVLIIALKVDFGPMAKVEAEAIKGNDPSIEDSQVEEEVNVYGNGKVYDLLLPIIVLIASTFIMMIYTGGYFAGETLMDSFLKTDVGKALVYGGAMTIIFTALLYLPRKVVPAKEFIPVIISGMKSMFTAILVLSFAWTIGGLISELGTGEFIASLVNTSFPVWLIPAILFGLSSVMAFSTGTSWGTFGIMLPLGAEIVIQLNPELLLPAMAAVLAGSVFGDHASPISDTTILSSTGAGVRHIDHVNTQLPYALTVAVASIIGYVILGITNSTILALVISLVLLVAAVFFMKSKLALPKLEKAKNAYNS